MPDECNMNMSTGGIILAQQNCST